MKSKRGLAIPELMTLLRQESVKARKREEAR